MAGALATTPLATTPLASSSQEVTEMQSSVIATASSILGAKSLANIDSIVHNGGNSYTINYTFDRTTDRLMSNSGYTVTAQVDQLETTTSQIPFLPKTGDDFVLIGTPDTGTEVYQQYSGPTPETGDQWVYETTTTPSGFSVSFDDTLTATIGGSLSVNESITGYLIKANGQVEQVDTITFIATDFLNETLDDITMSASGDGQLVGTLTETLDNITPVASGTTFNILDVNTSIGDIVSITTGSVILEGTVTSGIDDITMFSAAVNSGTLTGSIEDLFSNISGDVFLTGESENTLERITITATTDQSSVGSTNVTLENIFSTSSGTVTVTGTLTETIDDITMFTGSIIFGDLDITLDDITIVVDSEVENLGSIAETLDDIIQVASGDISVDGIVLETLEDITAALAGEVLTDGSLNETLDNITLSTTSLPEIVSVLKYLVYLLDNGFGG